MTNTATVMTKEEVVTKMEEQITQLETALDVVEAKLQEKHDAQMAGEQAVQEMKEQIVTLKEEMNQQTELASAKKLLAKAESIEKDVQLQESLNKGIGAKYKEELLELFRVFFVADRDAGRMYKETEKAVILQMSINTAEEDEATLLGFVHRINGAFSEGRSAYIRAGFATESDRISTATGTHVHLGRMGYSTKATELKNKMREIRNYMGI